MAGHVRAPAATGSTRMRGRSMDFFERVRGPATPQGGGVSGALLALWAARRILPSPGGPPSGRREEDRRGAASQGDAEKPVDQPVRAVGDAEGPRREGRRRHEPVHLVREPLRERGGRVRFPRRAGSLRDHAREAVRLAREKPGRHVQRAGSDRGVLEAEVEAEASRRTTSPLRFALNNIRLLDGRVDFDDRPKKTKHTVRDLDNRDPVPLEHPVQGRDHDAARLPRRR